MDLARTLQLRHVVDAVTFGRIAQGGSTLTQQLARQAFLTPDKTWRRKFQELMLASRIERLYSKPQILDNSNKKRD